MDVSTVLTLVQTILQLLDSSISSEVKSFLGYKSQLDKLKATMSTIQAVLLNTEKQEKLQLPITITPITLERLKEAVYQADDLFDEVATVVQCKKLMDGNKLSKEVRLFFSRFNQIHCAFTKSREISKIREILDDIARDHRDFGSMQMVNFEVRKKNPRETHSFLCEEDVIIGRDDDKRIVIDMLLDTAIGEVVSVISIVGIGGLGKTTLAQYVYKDETIVRRFPLRMWVCVSDDFNVKVLLGQILEAATNQAIDNSRSMDQLQRKLREELNGKEFLLVLDDIWNEDPRKWQELRNLLTQGGSGSRVLVTTRSRKVACVVGSHDQTHELGGLSDQDSWNLFERMALEPGQVQLEARLIEIGKEIVRKCANVPLAIRVAGSLVKGNSEESWWQYFKNIDLTNMKHDDNGIEPVLKISYYYLPTQLKSCFSYCAVFPKDHLIEKEQLIELWMAQGFILPLDGQSFEVLGEEYFMNLLQRCFFQDVTTDDVHGILYCKMHDLIHDLARNVARIGIKSSDDQLNSLNDKTRHFFIAKNIDGGCYLTKMKNLRTILRSNALPSTSYEFLPLKMRYLRVLDLQRCRLKKLPSKIGELLHLRYLDLSKNKLSLLPNSITRLYNLQTLNLRKCSGLIDLPRNLSKLVNLRHLDIEDCNRLRHMPPGMNSMTSLHKLTMFVVSTLRVGGNFGELGELKNLNHLRGSMEIKMERGLTYDVAEVREGRYLINKPHLRDISIIWSSESEENNNAEALLQGLQPHYNLTRLRLKCYPGVSFPCWGDSKTNLKTSLPNLVEIHVDQCGGLDHLPLMSQLRHLKLLKIFDSGKLEYVESRSSSDRAPALLGGSRREDELVFFPSLVRLELFNLAKLKGWWKPLLSHSDSQSASNEDETEVGDVDDSNNNSKQKQEFPCLSSLIIYNCPQLKGFPFCLKLETLRLFSFDRAIGPMINLETLMPDGMNADTPASTSTSNNRKKQSQGLKEIEISDVGFLNSQFKASFQHLSILRIMEDTKIERLTTGEMGEVFQSGRLSSVRELLFRECSKLKSLSGRGVWEHFTSLETLVLFKLEELELEEEDVNISSINADVPWRCLALTLHNLIIHDLPKLVKLPKEMQHLIALQDLDIQYCPNLEELPAWIGCLSSLQRLLICDSKRLKSLPEDMRHLKRLTHLTLDNCSMQLVERCQERTGADWHKIQHIPHIDVKN